MDKSEAKRVLAKHLRKYKAKTYAELKDLIDELEVCEIAGPSGVRCRLEVQVFWDDKPNGQIRVIAAIDDGGWRAYCPLTAGLLVSPDHQDDGQAADHPN
jgi:hypothetical protein